ncbi:MAG: hypothetical protein Kow0090_12120 [Myxococcota bacterium]
MEFKLEHIFDCDILTLENAFDHPKIDEYIESRLSVIKKREVLERKENGTRVFTRMRVVPDYELPQRARQFISQERLEWIEESLRDREKHTSEYRIVPPIFKRQFKAEICFKMFPQGNGETLREVWGNIAVSIPGLKRKLEEYITPRIVRALDEEAHVINSFVKEHLFELKKGVE